VYPVTTTFWQLVSTSTFSIPACSVIHMLAQQPTQNYGDTDYQTLFQLNKPFNFERHFLSLFSCMQTISTFNSTTCKTKQV